LIPVPTDDNPCRGVREVREVNVAQTACSNVLKAFAGT